MKTHTPSPFDIIAWLLAVLTALFGQSSRCVQRVASMRGRVRQAFSRMAQRWVERGHAIAYDGEDDATVEKRIARMEWIAREPVKALRHLSRLASGLLRARLGGGHAPPSFTPPTLACAPLATGRSALAVDDTS